MNIGVFLLIEPFASVEEQLKRARDMGFDHADIMDTNAGGSMLGTAGFSPTVSLDDNPFEVVDSGGERCCKIDISGPRVQVSRHIRRHKIVLGSAMVGVSVGRGPETSGRL